MEDLYDYGTLKKKGSRRKCIMSTTLAFIVYL